MKENLSYSIEKSELLINYESYLYKEEHSLNTIEKYLRDLRTFLLYLKDMPLTKERVLQWKERLLEVYAISSVNSMIAAINNFLKWIGHPELCVKSLKIQRDNFSSPEKELTKEEYIRLVKTANYLKNERLSLVIQTLCATGIRVSELQYITVEAIHIGYAKVNSKRKHRTIFLPNKLCQLIKKYLKSQNRTSGAVFLSKNGKPLDRSNIWRDMKFLCEHANVKPEKVFPHNLRHLFARIYYTQEKDLSRLADLLGHTNINTTRIYTIESGNVHIQQIGKLNLVIT